MEDSDSDDGYMARRRRGSPERVRLTYRRREEDDDLYCRRTYMIREKPVNTVRKIMRNFPMQRGTYDSDEEEYSPSLQDKEHKPLAMVYKPRDGHRMISIRELLHRSRRSSRSVLYIRGPLHSGKAYFAKRIMEIEEKYNDRKVIRITGCKENVEKGDAIKNGPNLLFQKLREAFEKNYNFVVVEVKSRNKRVMEDLFHMAYVSEYSTYIIDIDVDIHSKSYKEKVRTHPWHHYEKITSQYYYQNRDFRMPNFVTMVDPSSLIPPSVKIPFYMKYVEDHSIPKKYEHPSVCDDDLSLLDDAIFYIATMKDIFELFPSVMSYESNIDAKVIDIVSKLITEMKPEPYKAPIEHHLAQCPSLEAKNVIDYDHKSLVYDDEGVLEVNSRKVIDYRHMHSQYMSIILEDVDLETVLEERKKEKMEKKMKFYEEFKEDEKASNPAYPNNWEITINSKRLVPHGKRKKMKNAKIRKVIEQSLMKNVQKGVKVLKIKETSQDSVDEPMEFVETVEHPYYIDEVLKKTFVEFQNGPEFEEKVKEFFIKIDSIPELRVVLQLIAQVDHLKIQFCMGAGEPRCYNPKDNLILVYVHDASEDRILKVLGHQLMHCAIHWTYKNGILPYAQGDNERKEEYEKIFMEIEKSEDENLKIIKNLLKISENSHCAGLAGIFGELAVSGTLVELTKDEKLWDFCNRMIKDVNTFSMRFMKGGKGVLQ